MFLFFSAHVQTKVISQAIQLSNHVIVGCRLLNLEKVPVLLIMNFIHLYISHDELKPALAVFFQGII